MKRLLLRLSLVAVAAAGTAALLAQSSSPWPFPSRAAVPQGPTRNFTVAFWNIQWFPGQRPNPSKTEEAQQITAVHGDIAKLKADIIGMEEVRDFTQAGVAVEKLPGFKVDVCANFPPREGQKETQQVAIASRFPALSAWAEEWQQAGAATPPRGFAFAAYEVAPRQLVLVYAVHLKSNRGELSENLPMRQESIRQLRSHVTAMEAAYNKMGKISWIIGGDFNTSLDDPKYAKETTLRELMDNGWLWSWKNVQPSSRMTLPPSGEFPATCFDHVFYKGPTLRSAAMVVTTPQSSDHRAITATFDLPPAGP